MRRSDSYVLDNDIILTEANLPQTIAAREEKEGLRPSMNPRPMVL
jgi:hypothetical protein